jgi:hypothetical protein
VTDPRDTSVRATGKARPKASDTLCTAASSACASHHLYRGNIPSIYGDSPAHRKPKERAKSGHLRLGASADEAGVTVARLERAVLK